MLCSNCCKFLFPWFFFFFFCWFYLVKPDLLEMWSNKLVPSITLLSSIFCETLTNFCLTDFSFKKNNCRPALQWLTMEYFVITGLPFFPFKLPRHSWVPKRSKENMTVLPSRQEAVVDLVSWELEHTLHPISCECCCYVRSYSAAFVKSLPRRATESAPNTEHLF